MKDGVKEVNEFPHEEKGLGVGKTSVLIVSDEANGFPVDTVKIVGLKLEDGRVEVGSDEGRVG